MNRTWLAAIPAASAALAFSAIAMIYVFGSYHFYIDLLTVWGAGPYRFPFLDTHAVLSAIECHRRGIDVYIRNPCDALGRIHAYSPLWLAGSVLPITTAWTPVLGLALAVLFLLSLTRLPAGRGWWQTGMMTLGTLSSSTAFAVERGNIDVVVFVVAVLTGILMQRRQAWRLLGYGVVLLAGMLKYYPAALLVLAVRERLAVLVAVALAAACAAAGFVALYAAELPRALASIPTFPYTYPFASGARNLPYAVAQLAGWPDRVGLALLAVLTLGAWVHGIAVSRRGDLEARVEALSAAEATFLLIGCTLFLGCFFTAQNLLYRDIHLLFVLPGLTVLAGGRHRPYSRPLLASCGLVLFLMWEATAAKFAGLVLRCAGFSPEYAERGVQMVGGLGEALRWPLAVLLIAVSVNLVARSPAARELADRVPALRRA